MENLTDDFYEFIGVKRNATSKEINAACKRLLMKYHPDKCKDVWADGITKRINEIKEVLLDAEKRKEYDKKLSEPKDSKQEEQKGRERKEAEEKARKEAARQEAARQEAARQKAARQEAVKKAKSNRQKKLAIGVILCFLIFGGVALINATGLKDSQSTPSGVSPSSDPIAVNGDGTTSQVDTTVSGQPLTIADFSADPTSGYAPLTVIFTDKSTGSPTSWNWSFGDGVTSTEKNTMHIYSTAGNYTVKETVTNGTGENPTTKEGYITVMPSVNTGTVSDNTKTDSDSGTTSDNTKTDSDSGTTSDNTKTDSDSGTTSDNTNLPTKSEVVTFVSKYQGVSNFIENVSENSKSDHPEWKWDIWQDQNGNKVISFYYYQNNSKGYGSTYFDSEGNIISPKDLKSTPIYSYPGA